MMNTESVAQTTKKRKYISQADIPSIRLEEALRVPFTIAESYALDPTRPLDIAEALSMTPSSGSFRTLLGAAVGYGLTDGGPKATTVALTPAGTRLVAPLEEGDAARALREAALTPSIAQKFYGKYDGNQLPSEQIAQNVLISFGVPKDKAKYVLEILLENARFAGLTKQIKEKTYIDILGATPNPLTSSPSPASEMEEDGWIGSYGPDGDRLSGCGSHRSMAGHDTGENAGRSAIFLGHGSNRQPMDQLVKILNEYGIPHKIAVDEPSNARPIPQKVADVMRECGAAILIFTADREYFDENGRSIWRPSDNVSHELGAASVLYGDRIVIFKERSVDLPSNFSSIGYIEFESDKLIEKGIELFRELVSMKILNISVG